MNTIIKKITTIILTLAMMFTVMPKVVMAEDITSISATVSGLVTGSLVNSVKVKTTDTTYSVTIKSIAESDKPEESLPDDTYAFKPNKSYIVTVEFSEKEGNSFKSINKATINGEEHSADNIGSVFVSSIVITTEATIPDVPENFEAVATKNSGEVLLTWNAPANDGGISITDYQYSSDNGSTWKSCGSTNTTYTVTGLTNGTAYNFIIRAVNAKGAGGASSIDDATPITKPSKPSVSTSLIASGDDKKINLSWNVSDNGGEAPSKYKIYEKVDDSEGIWLDERSPYTDECRYALTIGKTLTYKVMVYNDAGWSEESDPVTVRYDVPSAPTYLNATARDSQVQLTWGMSDSSDVTGYEVSKDGGVNWIVIESTLLTAPIAGLTNGTTYTFVVRAVNEFGKSANSVPVTATPNVLYNITIGSGDATNNSTHAVITKSVPGETINIRANAVSNMEFDKWVIKSGNVTLADVNSDPTQFIMPAGNVEIEATYKPIMLSGEGGKYTKGSNTGLTFKSSAELDDLVSVFVDDNQVNEPADFTSAEGSTIITLKSAYLETLSVGEHIIYINSTSGSVSANFTVVNKSIVKPSTYAIPKTGVN